MITIHLGPWSVDCITIYVYYKSWSSSDVSLLLYSVQRNDYTGGTSRNEYIWSFLFRNIGTHKVDPPWVHRYQLQNVPQSPLTNSGRRPFVPRSRIILEYSRIRRRVSTRTSLYSKWILYISTLVVLMTKYTMYYL